jgi:hypothetical protein
MKPFRITRLTTYHLRSYCECGQELPFHKTPFMSNASRVCPMCGRVHYEDVAPIEWQKVYKGARR